MAKLTTTKLLLLLLCFVANVDMRAQTGVPFNQRDDQYRLLGLKRSKEAYEVARREFDRQQQLFEKGLISQIELDRSHSIFADAEVNYQQSLLAVLFEKQYVAVSRAVKFQSDDGRKRVRLTLENTSGGGEEFKKLVHVDDELFRSLQPDVIHDVYISLLNDQNTIISQPYEAKVEELRYGKPAVIQFDLLQDLDAVVVNIYYGNGSQRSPKILLQKDASEDRAIVQAEQFSQEVELGGSASFDLTLELFSGTTNTFKLEVVNLPRQINCYFNDPATQARLSQFKFTESSNSKRAALQVFLPDRPSEEVVIDRAIPFYVLLIPRERAAEFGEMRSRTWQREEIEALQAGYVRLELIPRGLGKLLVRAPRLYHSVKPGEAVTVDLDLVNEGSRRLDNIVVEVDPPLNWQKNVEPMVVPALEIGEEKRIAVQLQPANGVAEGRYEARLRTTSLSDNKPVNGEDKSITIEVRPETNVMGIALITLLIIGLVAGIVVFGVRLSRR